MIIDKKITRNICLLITAVVMLMVTLVSASAFDLVLRGGQGGYNMGSIWGNGTYLYSIDAENGFYAFIFDGADFNQYGYNSQESSSVWGEDNYVYVADGYNGEYYVMSFDGSNFVKLDSETGLVISGGPDTFWADGTYIYAANYQDGMYAFTFNGTDLVQVGYNNTWVYPYGVWGDGTYLYAPGYEDFKVYAYTFNGNAFEILANAPCTSGNTDRSFSVWGDGTYVYETCGYGGIDVYTFNGSAFTFITNLPPPLNVENDTEQVVSILGDGTFIYVISRESLHAYTFNGSVFTELASASFAAAAYDLWVDENYIYVAASSDGLYAFELSGCLNDTDCGLCEYCNVGTCENQSGSEDLKDECDNFWHECVNDYSIKEQNGLCDGSGECYWEAVPVGTGQVCFNDDEQDPTADVHCGIWSDCIINETSADEYYVGYLDDLSGNCANDWWQSSGTTQEATEGYWWDATEQVDNCTEALIPCVNDTDCDFCEYCNAGTCEYQISTDTKDECSVSSWADSGICRENRTNGLCGGAGACAYEVQFIPHHTDPYSDCSYVDNCLRLDYYNDGYCDGSGMCNAASSPVAVGNVCINGTIEGRNHAPTIGIHCGIWSDCVIGEVSAAEYYVGYAYQVGSYVCARNDNWTATGTFQNATPGYQWDATEQVDTCSEECVPDWSCSEYSCDPDNMKRCTDVVDLELCGLNYSGDYSEFTLTCIYPVQSGNNVVFVSETSNTSNVTDLVIKQVKDKTPLLVNFSGISIDLSVGIPPGAIVIENKKITINSELMPELDVPARITVYNIGPGYHIYKDGDDCTDTAECVVVSYGKYSKVLIFDVLGFSTYVVGSYNEDDIGKIVIDGIGTAGASFVSLMDLLIISLVVLLISAFIVKAKGMFK
jgi:hypothetical protein